MTPYDILKADIKIFYPNIASLGCGGDAAVFELSRRYALKVFFPDTDAKFEQDILFSMAGSGFTPDIYGWGQIGKYKALIRDNCSDLFLPDSTVFVDYSQLDYELCMMIENIVQGNRQFDTTSSANMGICELADAIETMHSNDKLKFIELNPLLRAEFLVKLTEFSRELRILNIIGEDIGYTNMGIHDDGHLVIRDVSKFSFFDYGLDRNLEWRRDVTMPETETIEFMHTVREARSENTRLTPQFAHQRKKPALVFSPGYGF